MLTCSYCGRNDFKKPQGLNGHIRMLHGVSNQVTQEIDEVPDMSELWTEELIKELAIQTSEMVSKALETSILKMKQESPEPLTAKELQQVVHLEVVQLGQALQEDLTKELNHHLCIDAACVICKPTVDGIRARTIEKIEERLPGTMEGLQSYEALNTPAAGFFRATG